jgi:hypothetical protein
VGESGFALIHSRSFYFGVLELLILQKPV